MQQRDYILRMIEQLGAALVRLRQMITGQASSAEVHAEMQKTAMSAGVNLEMARLMSTEMLVSLISAGRELNPSRCWMTAELLLLDAMAAETRGDAGNAEISFTKALGLYELLEPAGAFLVGWPEARERVEEINAALVRLRPSADEQA
jgi:hypothetical protein